MSEKVCVCAHACVFVGICVFQTDSERSCVYSQSRGSLPIAQNTKRNTPGGLLGNPSAHRERAEERLTYRKQLGGAHTHTNTHPQLLSHTLSCLHTLDAGNSTGCVLRFSAGETQHGQNCKPELNVLLH